MYDLGVDAIAELVGYGIGAVAFTVLGLFAEGTAITTLLGGAGTVTAMWLAAVGAVLLYAGLAYCGRGFLASLQTSRA